MSADLQKIIIVCVGVVIVGGLLGYVLSKNTNEGASITANEDGVVIETKDGDTTAALDDNFTGEGSMMELFRTGRSIECSYSYNDPETGVGEGRSYFEGSMMRVDSELTLPDGNTYESHVINDGDHMWSWVISNEGTFAFVTPINEPEAGEGEFDPSLPESRAEVETLTENVAYECRSWNPDESIFAPPSNVDFVDMAAMMEGIMQGGMDGEAMQHMMEGLPTP